MKKILCFLLFLCALNTIISLEYDTLESLNESSEHLNMQIVVFNDSIMFMCNNINNNNSIIRKLLSSTNYTTIINSPTYEILLDSLDNEEDYIYECIYDNDEKLDYKFQINSNNNINKDDGNTKWIILFIIILIALIIIIGLLFQIFN